MTPEHFVQRNPNWKSDVTEAVGSVLLTLIRGPMPPPWSDETIIHIGQTATEMTITVFEQYRPQMGDEIFGELVLFTGEEAKRLACVAAGRPLPVDNAERVKQ